MVILCPDAGAPRLGLVPEGRLDDEEVGSLDDHPLGFGSELTAAPTGAREAHPAGAVPDQPSTIQLIGQDDADGTKVPAGPDAISPSPVGLRLARRWHASAIETRGDGAHAKAVGIPAKDPADDFGFVRIENPAYPDPPGLAIAIGLRRIVDRLTPVPVGNAAGAPATSTRWWLPRRESRRSGSCLAQQAGGGRSRGSWQVARLSSYWLCAARLGSVAMSSLAVRPRHVLTTPRRVACGTTRAIGKEGAEP
jgi:hypothetical protein